MGAASGKAGEPGVVLEVADQGVLVVVVHVGDDAPFRCVVCASGALVRHRGGCNAYDQGGFFVYSARCILLSDVEKLLRRYGPSAHALLSMHHLAEAERHNALSWPSGRSLRRLKLASCACNLLKLVVASTSKHYTEIYVREPGMAAGKLQPLSSTWRPCDISFLMVRSRPHPKS